MEFNGQFGKASNHIEHTSTCTPNERAFLDEIREKFSYGNYEGQKVLCFKGSPIETKYSLIYQSNFTTPLKELVNDPETKVD